MELKERVENYINNKWQQCPECKHQWINNEFVEYAGDIQNENKILREQNAKLIDTWDKSNYLLAVAKIDKQQARIERLEAALQPFAKVGKIIRNTKAGLWTAMGGENDDVKITAHDCIVAKQALDAVRV